MDIPNSIALVTGANKGIGFEVARALAAQGATVWIGARDEMRGREAATRLRDQGLKAEYVALDVTDDNSVKLAAEQVTRDSGRLDILVNNAGIALDRVPPSEVGFDLIRATFETNVYGVIRVTQAFLPLLRRSASGRIVMVGSDIGSHTNQTNPDYHAYANNPLAYAASKAALNAVMISFAKELRDTPIKVNTGNPGFTATDLNEFRATRPVSEGAAPILTLATLPDDGPTATFLGPDGPEPW